MLHGYIGGAHTDAMGRVKFLFGFKGKVDESETRQARKKGGWGQVFVSKII